MATSGLAMNISSRFLAPRIHGQLGFSIITEVQLRRSIVSLAQSKSDGKP